MRTRLMIMLLVCGSLLMCATAIVHKEYSEAIAWGVTAMAYYSQGTQLETIEAFKTLTAAQDELITRLQKTIDDYIEEKVEAPVAQEEERR